jgi:hypothetical protein
MAQVLHGSAKTTHVVRTELQRSSTSVVELARHYGLRQPPSSYDSREFDTASIVHGGKELSEKLSRSDPCPATRDEVAGKDRPKPWDFRNALGIRPSSA